MASPFLQGGGEMGHLTRNFDWSQTSLGEPGQWPQSLLTIVNTILNSKFPMFLWWGVDMIQFYNDAYRPSLGNQGKHPKALGQKGKDCWPEIWDIISPLIRQVQETGVATWREDQLIPIYRNGKIEDVYWTYSYSAVLDDRGWQTGVLVTCTETTEKVKNLKEIEESVKEQTEELREANLQLTRFNEELSRSNSNLEEFAYAASHDMKEPIRKIHFFSDRIRRNLADRFTEEEIRYFDRMDAAARRMGSLIDDLLSYSQVSLRPRLFDEVNLNNVIRQVLNDLELEIEEKGAEIHVPELCVLKGYQRQVQQAFQNLISNALKFHTPGTQPVITINGKTVEGRHCELKLSAEQQQKKYYIVEVADNGIGFDPGDTERIFNVFTRLHGNAEYTGTGVGLSIVRKVAENHQGFVTANSEPGKGASFQLFFPLHAEEE